MKKSLIYILILLIFATDIAGQNKSFKVFYSQGSTFLLTGNKKTAVLKDMLIGESQSISIDKNASLILISPDGIAFPLTVAGKYTYAKLLSILSLIDKGLSYKYLTYVVHEMTESHEAKKDKVIGGVFRGEMLLRFPVDSCLVIRDTIKFSWLSGVSSPLLFLNISDKNHKPVFSKSLRDTTYNYKVLPKDADQDFVWAVGEEPYQTRNVENRTFTVASLVTAERLKKELLELEFDPNLPSEYKKLMLLNFYEKNHLFIEESNAIREANSQFPANSLIGEYSGLLLKQHR